MAYKDYTHLNARIRAMENYLLTRNEINEILMYPVESFISFLKSKSYGRYLVNFEFLMATESEFRDVIEFVINSVPEAHKELFMCFRYEYDFYNYYCTLNAMEDKMSLLGSVNKDDMIKFVKSENSIPQPLSSALSAIKDKDVNSIEQAKYSFISKIYNMFGIEYIMDFLKMRIDLLNISNFLRSKSLRMFPDTEYYIPYGFLQPEFFICDEDEFNKKIKLTRYYKIDLSLEKFEISSDDFILDYIDHAIEYFFGPEPAFAFVIKKKYEIKVLNLIYKCKIAVLNDAEIRNLLPTKYV